MDALNKKNVPKLRFPEFCGEWKDFQFSKFLAGEFREVPKPSGRYLAIGVRSHGRGTFQKPDSEPDAISMENLFEVRENDLIVNITFAWEGAIALVRPEDDGGLVSHRFPTYRFDEKNVTYKFFPYVIEDRRFRKKLELISPGGAGRNRVLSKSEFLKLEYSFPTLPEQKKIAAFLSAVDEKLAALRKKRDLLIEYKRGVMQQIFSRAVRFKRQDGNDFPKWEVRKLCDIAERRTIKNSRLGNTRVLTNSAVHGVIDQGEYFDKEIANGENLGGYYIVENGDFVYNPRISVSAPVGPIKRNNLGTGVMSPLYSIFRIYVGCAKFYEQYFESDCWHEYMKSVANYGARHDRIAVNTSDFMAMPLPWPHPDEQGKIADFLRALDMKIDATSALVTHNETFKKGLLQRMFV